jgi:hypothetical protein
MNQEGEVLVQMMRDTVLIELADIRLNIYQVAEDYVDKRLREDWVKKIDRHLRKIKCPRELKNLKVVLEIDNGYFYNNDGWNKHRKCIPQSVIRQKARFHFMEDNIYNQLDRNLIDSEEQIKSIFLYLNQKELIERLILEIAGLNSDSFADFYVENSSWLSYDDLLDIYYTFKIKK